MEYRCEVSDLHIAEAFRISGGWGKHNLTWSLHRYLPPGVRAGGMPQDDQKRAIREAFNMWAAVADIRFTEMPDLEDADLILAFLPRSHGDGNDFKESELAHGFIPNYLDGLTPLEGDVHFYEVQPWGVDVQRGLSPIDLRTVAAHEIGHALGLGHSDVQDSVMYYLHLGPRPLHPDDVAAIRQIYGEHRIEGMYAIDHSFSSIPIDTFLLFQADGIEMSIQGLWHPGRNTVAYNNLRNALGAGMKVAGYLAVNNNYEGATHVDEARAVAAENWESLSFVAVDVELSPIRFDIIRDAINRVIELGQRPVLYTANWFWKGILGNPQWFADIPLWNAYYDGDPDFDFAMAPYGAWAGPVGEQYTNTTRIYGVDVDYNRFEADFLEAVDMTPEELRFFREKVIANLGHLSYDQFPSMREMIDRIKDTENAAYDARDRAYEVKALVDNLPDSPDVTALQAQLNALAASLTALVSRMRTAGIALKGE